MGELSLLDAQLPAHLQTIATDSDDWSSGTTIGFPSLSTEGKQFSIKRGKEYEPVLDSEGEPARSLLAVIMKANQGVAKTWYEKSYDSESADKPDCYSLNGVEPARDAENKQSKLCETCPRNAWGSRITDSGKEAKECSDVKRLAVAAVGQLNDPMLLRVPPTSLRNWDNYVDLLRKRGLNPAQVVTKVRFDPKMTHQVLMFEPIAFVTEEQVAQIADVLALPILDAIVGSVAETSVHPEAESRPPKPTAKAKARAVETEPEDDDEAEAPPPPKPKPKKRATKKAAPEPKPEPVEVEEASVEDADDADLDGLDFDDLDFGDED